MSDTETHHEPTPDEAAHDGSDRGHHPGDIAGEAHGVDDHGETDGHDDHARGAETLGPLDVERWGALVLGVAAGLLVAACLVITQGLSPAA